LETKTSASRNCQTPNGESISQKPNQFTSPQSNITQRKQNSQVQSKINITAWNAKLIVPGGEIPICRHSLEEDIMQGFFISTCLFLSITFRKGKTRAKHWGYGKLIIILWVVPFTSVTSVSEYFRERRRIRDCSSIYFTELGIHTVKETLVQTKTEPCRSMKQKHVLYQKPWIHNLS